MVRRWTLKTGKIEGNTDGVNILLPFDLANHLSKYKNGAEGYNISYFQANLFDYILN
jgi:hypothetical protein